MLPPLDADSGLLPVGEHEASWAEVMEHFGWNERRRALLDGLAEALELLAAVGCRRVWLNGSFVTGKDEPGDFDACWDTDGVDVDEIDPVFLDLTPAGRPRSTASAASLPERHRGRQRPRVRGLLPKRTRRFPQGDRRLEGRRTNMITNDVQYRSTKAHLAQFEEALTNLRADADKKPTKRQQLEIDAVAAQADDLRAEIQEYERLSSGTVSTFEATTLAGLATLLIQARIARGWTQARLADELGVAEQQIQRYEATEYRSASLARICDVAAALGIDVAETGRLRAIDAA